MGLGPYRNRLLSLVAFTTLVLCPAVASATVYAYNFTETSTGGGPSVGDFSGQLTVVNGTVTAITGSGAGIGTITGLFAPGVFLGNDNAFSPTSPYFDNNGISFSSTVYAQINIYNALGTELEYNYTAGDVNYGSFSASLISQDLPEPDSLTIEAGALALLALVLSKRHSHPHHRQS